MRTLTITCTATIFFIFSQTAQASIQAAKAGADYLVNVQLVDGGWSWENGGTSAENITGATGIGLIRYYDAIGGSGYLNAAKDAGDYIRNHTYTNGENRFSTFDPYFSWKLSLSAGDSTWSDHAATQFFDELTAGTYGPNNYDTAGFVSAVQVGRTGTWVNLRPWEFSTIALTARNIGNGGQADLFRQGILDGLNTLDNTAPSNVYRDLIGVTGGVRGLALDGLTTFTAINSPLHAGINGINTLSGLAGYLVNQQNTDGSWYRHSNLTSPGEDDKDTQTTAYAILALEAAAVAAGTNYDSQIAVARNWLTTMQDGATGGFHSFPGDTDPLNNEVSGEATAALVPEPISLMLLSLGPIALLRRSHSKR